MRKLSKYIFLLFMMSTLAGQTPGKRESQYGFEVYYRPPIYYDFYTELTDTENKVQLNFLLKIQNDLFRFTNQDNRFVALYNVTVAVKKAEGTGALFSETWRQNVEVASFNETNSKSIYQTDKRTFVIDLPPGEYRLFLEVIDSGTDKGYRNSRAFKVESNPVHSEVKLFQPQENVSSEIILGPDPPAVNFNQDQKAGFMFRSSTPDSLIITSKLLRMEGETSPIVRQKIYRILPVDNITRFYEILERKYLKEGQYLLKYRIKYNQQITNFEKYFSVVWFEKPVYLYKHDLALRPMQYMLTPDEFEYADGLSYDELGSWMEEFWEAKDPTPDTPLNEIKYQYFLRVAEANKKYSQRFTEGWETDRGKALILYGNPTRIESNRYAINKKPYEIWYYESLNRKLTFVDQNKEENYELLSVENIEETGNE